MAGAAFGDLVHAVAPGSGGSVGAYALIGMGAVFAGAARAPITAVVILFELTGEYSIILPLMLAIALATGISHLVSRDSVYTRKLLRRGIDIDEPADAALRRRPVSAFMVPPPEAVVAGTDLKAAAARFVTTGESCVPVVDTDGRYLGTLSSHALMDALAADDPADIVGLTADSVPVSAATPVGDALARLDKGAAAVPVAGPDHTLIGWVRHRDILRALSTAP